MVDEHKAQEIYKHIKVQLKGQEGKIVAIDTDSGDFFVGKTTIDAYHKGRKKYPGKEFFFTRVGAKATYFVG